MHGISEIVSQIFWSAIVIVGGGWLLWRGLKRSNEQGTLLIKIIASVALAAGGFFFVRGEVRQLHAGSAADNTLAAFAIVGSILVAGALLAGLWTPQISALLFSPITNLLDGGNEKPEHRPFYSIAESRRKKGDIAGAIAEVRRQLGKFPNHFEGVLLLASLQAENLKDFAAAEKTLEQFCSQTPATDNNIAAAWNALADWHLKTGRDAVAARAALEKIIARMPGAELALLAEQRIAHLGGADANETIEPGRLAAAHVRHLQNNPDDAVVREKLAVIYARDFRRLDLAAAELRHLIDDARHPPRKIIHWLRLLANLQAELGADVSTVRGTLETIVARFPDLPAAGLARERLAHIEAKLTAKNAGQNVRRL